MNVKDSSASNPVFFDGSKNRSWKWTLLEDPKNCGPERSVGTEIASHVRAMNATGSK